MRGKQGCVSKSTGPPAEPRAAGQAALGLELLGGSNYMYCGARFKYKWTCYFAISP